MEDKYLFLDFKYEIPSYSLIHNLKLQEKKTLRISFLKYNSEIIIEILQKIIEDNITFKSSGEARKYIIDIYNKMNCVKNKDNIKNIEELNNEISIEKIFKEELLIKKEKDKENLFLYENAVYVDYGILENVPKIKLTNYKGKKIIEKDFEKIINNFLFSDAEIEYFKTNSYLGELVALIFALDYAIKKNVNKIF